MQKPYVSAAPAYSRMQVALHWLIAALIGVQWLAAEGMEDFFDRYEDSGPPGFPTGDGLIHASVGVLILALMLVRLWVRVGHGAPPHPDQTPWHLEMAAKVDHFALYGVVILLPLTGLAALYVSTEAADLHELLKTALIVLLVLHVAGAAYHALVRRDGMIWRMIHWRDQRS